MEVESGSLKRERINRSGWLYPTRLVLTLVGVRQGLKQRRGQEEMKKAKELDNRRDGDRRQCAACKPSKKGEVRLEQVWRATLAFGGSSHRRDHSA